MNMLAVTPMNTYKLTDDFSSVSGLNHSASDAQYGQAPSYSGVDFGFHSTSMEISDQRTLQDDPEAYLVVQQAVAPRRVGRPDGSATGSTPEVPIGDAALPFLLLAFAFVLFRRHKHAQQVR